MIRSTKSAVSLIFDYGFHSISLYTIFIAAHLFKIKQPIAALLHSYTHPSPQTQSLSYHHHPYSSLCPSQQPLTLPAPFSHLAASQNSRCPVTKLDKDLKFDEEMPVSWWQWDFYIESNQSCFHQGSIRSHLQTCYAELCCWFASLSCASRPLNPVLNMQ